ncbi:hypothetical protein QBC36DRAFT_360725 [Triangularia setosa]|uniref:MARVEL domain-containing protein n=1 Tax=Triangularia setosa TaxID=2587417 RepID=A0AAN6W1C3_9PEZI|nr:hypothetical protein QBC36DRAFT_360725 [Podospora setosa]
MSTQGLTAKGVPPQPLWLLYIKIAILVLSLITLALGAWAVSIFGGYLGGYGGPTGAGGLVIFTAIWSFIVYGGAAAIEIWAPHFFYRIGALVGYILHIIFWLSAWAWSASAAAFWLSYTYGFLYDSSWKREGQALGACAGLGALICNKATKSPNLDLSDEVDWLTVFNQHRVLSIVHLVFFIRASMSDPEGSGLAPGTAGQAELGQVKPEQQYPAQQTYPVQQQQPYPAQ